MENTKDFFNPSSMMTPGIAGAMTMTITNTFVRQFESIEPWSAMVALIVSFLFGLLVVAAKTMPYWQRLIYYILNSFIIFTVSVGSNTLGQAGGDSHAGAGVASLIERHMSLASFDAYAANDQPPSVNGWCCINGRVNPSPREECNRWGGQIFPSQEEAQRACQSKESGRENTGTSSRFFRPWFQN
jgi:hypothetical protein